MNIQEQLQNDLKAAMRAGERLRVDVIRMTLAALKSAQMALVKQAYDAAAPDEGDDPAQIEVALSDAAMLDTLAKEVKRRRDAADLYRKGHREDLAAQEESEAAILEGYLPRQMSADELRPELEAAIAATGAKGIADMGRVMPVVMQQFKGRAEGRLLSQLTREILSQRG